MIDVLFIILLILSLLFVATIGYTIGYRNALKYVSASIYTIMDKLKKEKDTQD